MGDAKLGDHRVFCATGEGDMQASGLMREEGRNLPPPASIVVHSRRIERLPSCERRGRRPATILSSISRLGLALSCIGGAMSTTGWIILIVVLFLVFGGFGWSRRGR